MSDGTERWLPVVGYEGYYEVSDQGRVRSVERFVAHGRGASMRRVRERVLAPHHLPKDGRARVSLARDNVDLTRLVHVLVLEAFVGPRPEGFDGCHNNGDASDNRLANLRWDTRSENMYDKNRHGTNFMLNKTDCPRGHALVEPNLVASVARQGNRSCLSCARARAARQYAQKRGEPFDFEADAHARYADLMGSRRAA